MNVAIKKIIDGNGRLAVVVHNAGHMVFGSLEAFTRNSSRNSVT